MADIAYNSLCARVNVHMLDGYVLLTLASFPRQSFDLHREGSHEFGRQAAEHVQPFDTITLVHVACGGATHAGDQFEQGNVRDSYMGSKHRFDLVFRPHPIDDGQGGH